MKFLKENWLKIIIVLVIAWLIIAYLDGKIKDKQYRKNIEDKNIEIAKGEKKVKVIMGMNDDLRDERKKAKAASDKKIAKMKENQRKELARIGLELDGWKARVKEMPASTVVIKIRTILKTDEVWERPDGILFSLIAARECLAVLGDFSLVKERDQWKADYNEAMSIIKEKDDIIATDEFIFYNFDAICFTKDGIIEKEREKFSLSEGRNRASWWRGVKSGGLVLGIIGFIGGFVLGR